MTIETKGATPQAPAREIVRIRANGARPVAVACWTN